MHCESPFAINSIILNMFMAKIIMGKQQSLWAGAREFETDCSRDRRAWIGRFAGTFVCGFVGYKPHRKVTGEVGNSKVMKREEK